ncbi:hypothetical protein B9W64_37685 [Streptomyces sp. CS159]|nr:hypothetical protein B9W64_37685 [Streptomyces sp. CS159]
MPRQPAPRGEQPREVPNEGPHPCACRASWPVAPVPPRSSPPDWRLRSSAPPRCSAPSPPTRRPAPPSRPRSPPPPPPPAPPRP